MRNLPLVHVEISAKDPAAAGKFYNELFGWEVANDSSMDYVTFKSGEDMGGGFPKIDGEMYKPGDVVVYIHSDDIDSTLKHVEECGGKTALPKTEIPGMGWFALFTDPSGNRIGLFTPNMG